MALNNRQLSRAGDVIFANDTAYIVELPMAGRGQESRTMQHALTECDGPRAVTMTASLGAGKTFFVNKMMAAHSERVAEFDERRNCRFLFATNEEPSVDAGAPAAEQAAAVQEAVAGIDNRFAGASGLRVLVVEELDRKASLEQLDWSVHTATAWLGLGGDRLLILTGEALALPDFEERLSTIDTRFEIALKALDVELLKEALTGRIAERLVKPTREGIPDEDATELAKAATDAILHDDYIRWAAIPKAEPAALANFREALGALKDLSEHVGVQNDAAVEFPRALLAHFQGNAQVSGLARSLDAALLEDLSSRIASGQPIPAMSAEELAVLIDKAGDAKFRRRAIEPLARQGVLTPLGVPYSQRDERGNALMYAEPFMPSYSMVHRALADLVCGTR